MVNLCDVDFEEPSEGWLEDEVVRIPIELIEASPMPETLATEFAARPLLSRGQAIAVVLASKVCLYLNTDHVIESLKRTSMPLARLLSEERTGKFTLPCTPGELLKWSVRSGVQLPQAFVAAIRAQRGAKGAAASPQIGKTKRTRMSRLDENGIDPEIQKAANELAAELWAKGQKKTRKDDITKALATRFTHIEPETIHRRYHLPRRR
jgi:hypothetical protein